VKEWLQTSGLAFFQSYCCRRTVLPELADSFSLYVGVFASLAAQSKTRQSGKRSTV
jgi:hypothetical protein